MRHRLLLPLLVLSALVLVAAACGDDGGSAADDPTTTTTDDATTTAPPEDDGDDADPDDTTTTTLDDGGDDADPDDTTTTAAPAGPSGSIADGTVTTADGLTVEWELSADPEQLCFTTTLSHTDPAEQAVLGDGQDECFRPAGGLDAMDSGLSVDVGTADGEKRVGYLWGRVDPSVIRLTIEHGDGTLTSVDLLEGPTDVKLFAYVVDVATIPPVVGLDAISGEQIEGSANIRDFLRAGPTYPTVPPSTTTTTTPDYPTS